MRTIIAGSRSCNDYRQVLLAVDGCGWTISAVVSGAARGVDRLGERWATANGIPIDRHAVTAMQWRENGRRAGYLRNVRMSECADALIALWDGWSPGTKHMIDIAVRKGLLTHVHFV